MVSITEDDDVHLLDVDDVDILKIVTTEGNSLNVEDDVWIAVVARLGMRLIDEQLVWGYVQPESNQLLMNLKSTCTRLTMLQCDIQNKKPIYFLLHQL
ncbi:hypothetical protein V6N11_052106 [Hibiscus sabdariffa]|uniref:Uncharacterized protein n=1 Tax=Hibiscus sabdariffa TaxID=183260 RepID=A0ABR2U916_9ROSI